MNALQRVLLCGFGEFTFMVELIRALDHELPQGSDVTLFSQRTTRETVGEPLSTRGRRQLLDSCLLNAGLSVSKILASDQFRGSAAYKLSFVACKLANGHPECHQSSSRLALVRPTSKHMTFPFCSMSVLRCYMQGDCWMRRT